MQEMQKSLLLFKELFGERRDRIETWVGMLKENLKIFRPVR